MVVGGVAHVLVGMAGGGAERAEVAARGRNRHVIAKCLAIFDVTPCGSLLSCT